MDTNNRASSPLRAISTTPPPSGVPNFTGILLVNGRSIDDVARGLAGANWHPGESCRVLRLVLARRPLWSPLKGGGGAVARGTHRRPLSSNILHCIGHVLGPLGMPKFASDALFSTHWLALKTDAGLERRAPLGNW